MDNFIFHNPTRLIFGKGMIAQLSQQIPADKRIMITFGGGSVKTNGVYEQVIQALEGRDYTEFWGIESNPDISTLKKAIESGKEKTLTSCWAVGGGSVIDGTKLISAGIPYDGDAWELVKKGSAQNTIPLGTVLTIPATGSEMNNGAVISCRETHEKISIFLLPSCIFYPRSDSNFLTARLSDSLRTGRHFCTRHGTIHDQNKRILSNGPLERKHPSYIGTNRSANQRKQTGLSLDE